jgi:two-component system response regulator DevR
VARWADLWGTGGPGGEESVVASGVPIRVLLVDDHEVVRVGLRGLLSDSFSVVGEGSTAAEAVSMADALHPDVVVLDVRLPDGSGVEACREIRARRPETRVIMLTSFSDEEALFHAILAGASGYLLKQARGSDLAQAIRRVHGGESLLDPVMVGSVFERLRVGSERGDAGPLSALTDQERRVLPLIAEGKTNREIAALVFLSEKTVKHYVSSILTKLDVRRRSEAAAIWARRQEHVPGGV